jgi:hypothetical protein
MVRLKVISNTRKPIQNYIRSEKRLLLVPVFSVTFSWIVLSWFDLFHTYERAPCYMLSALVQSEAAIMAIVIILTLVAVQLTASSYSPRIAEIFIRSLGLWIIMILYISAVISGLAVLGMIEANPESNFNTCIKLCYVLGICCFTALIPYTYNMLTILKPAKIIEKLSQKINGENIFEKNSIYLITDIIRSSIIKNDYETVEIGLRAIGSSISSIYEKKDLNEEKERKISAKMYHHFCRIDELAIGMKDECSLLEILEIMEKLGNTATEKQLKDGVRMTVECIDRIGKESVEKRLEGTAERAVESLGIIGKKLIQKKLDVEIIITAIQYIDEIGKVAAQEELEKVAEKAVESLGIIGEVAVERELPLLRMIAIGEINAIGEIAMKKELKRPLWKEASCFDRIIETAKKKNLEDIVKEIENYIRKLKKRANDKKFVTLSSLCSTYLQKI